MTKEAIRHRARAFWLNWAPAIPQRELISALPVRAASSLRQHPPPPTAQICWGLTFFRTFADSAIT